MSRELIRAREALALFTVDQRRDLARFLDASPEARVDLIRQSFQRGHESLGELLIDLEEDRQTAGLVRLAIESMDY